MNKYIGAIFYSYKGGRDLKISEIKYDARKYLKGYWGKGVLLTFIYFIINSGITTSIDIVTSGGFDKWVYQDTVSITADFSNVIISILIIPLTVSITWFYLDLVRSENPSVALVFKIYTDVKKALHLIGATVMIGIFTFLWSLLLVIPGIIKGLAYSQTLYLLKDNPDYGIFEAITESRKRMNGYKWKYFLLNLSFIGWGILGLFTLGIGYLWLIPYIYASNAAFYKNLIADKKIMEL